MVIVFIKMDFFIMGGMHTEALDKLSVYFCTTFIGLGWIDSRYSIVKKASLVFKLKVGSILKF